MKPGIHNLPDTEYFAHPAANNSLLKAMLVSPAHAKYQMDHPKEPTPAMKSGSACHTAILEPEEFTKRYAILPDNAPARPTEAMINAKNPSASSVERVTFWDQFERQCAGRTVLSNEEAAEYMHIGTVVRQHPELVRMFDSGVAEHSVFGNDPETGVLCKCRPDFLTQVGKYKIMLELKSTEDARPSMFAKNALKFGYFQAAAFYPDVMEWAGLGRPDLYLIIAFEKSPPYGVKIYEIPDEGIAFGQQQYRKALNLYKHCVDMNDWPNYDTTIEVLELPSWARIEE